MRRSFQFVTAAVAFSAFALLNPVVLSGCGAPPCGGGEGDTAEVTDEQVQAGIQPYFGEEHTYTATNGYGTLTFTIRIDESRLPEESASLKSPGEYTLPSNMVRSAHACSQAPRSGRVIVSGTISATFEQRDGETETVLDDREFDGVYVRESHGITHQGTIESHAANGPSFELYSPNGDQEFELREFNVPSYAIARIE